MQCQTRLAVTFETENELINCYKVTQQNYFTEGLGKLAPFCR